MVTGNSWRSLGNIPPGEEGMLVADIAYSACKHASLSSGSDSRERHEVAYETVAEAR